jgi:DNA modification methylase
MIIDKLASILADARETWEHAIPVGLLYDAAMDSYAGIRQDAETCGSIITSDNLQASKTLLAAITAGTLMAPRLIYMDPPFFTKAKYSEQLKLKRNDGSTEKISLDNFSDKWNESRDSDDFTVYLTNVAARIMAAYDLLKDDGVFWLHIDHHAAHYLKVLTDEIFGGSDHLINEVIWQYKSGGSSKRRFARKHDTLLFYAKNPKKYFFTPPFEKSYNRGRKPYRFKGVREYRDEGGWYTMIGMRDVWQIDMVGRTAHERTGYATQKPEALISRIVTACTQPGDLCVDLYGGSGTLAAVCDELGRGWLTIDDNPVAALHAERRMVLRSAGFEVMTGTNIEEVEVGAVGAVGAGASEGNEPQIKSGMTELPDCKNAPPVACGITINIQVSDAVGADKKLVTVEVTGYEPPAILKSVLTSEFIAAISADINADHEIFTPEAAAYDTSRLEMLIDTETIKEEKTITIRVIDIFGRRFVFRRELR